MSARQETTVRRGHRSGRGHDRRRWVEYKVELIGLFLVGVGLFLLLERMNLRRSVATWARSAISGLLSRFQNLDGEISGLLERVSLSDIVGVLLILVALVAILVRLRWRLLTASSLTDLSCPRCGGPIYRVHRKWYDRLLSLYAPVRRYRCRNTACRWKGLRFGHTHGASERTHASQST